MRCVESWQKMPGGDRNLCVGYIQLADVVRQSHDFERSREWLAKARDGGERLNDSGVVAEVALTLGLSFGAEGRLDEAEANLCEAARLYGQLGDVKRVATAHRFLAKVEIDRRNPVAARSLLEKTLELVRQGGDAVMSVFDLETRGQIELMEGALNLAERTFDEMVHQCESLGDRESLARGCWVLGYTLGLRGATDRAIVNLTRALDIYEGLGMRREADEVRVNLGIVGSPPS